MGTGVQLLFQSYPKGDHADFEHRVGLEIADEDLWAESMF